MSTTTDNRRLATIMHDKYDSDDGFLEVPVGGLTDQPVEKLVREANTVDNAQSMNARFYGSIAMREAMIRYYDGDTDRALAALDSCSNKALFTRLYELAEQAGLDERPAPWGE